MSTAVIQIDLFASDTDTDTCRLVDGLTCIRNSLPEAMYVAVHLAYWLPRDERAIRAGGDWAYSIRRDGLRFEHEAEWWRGAYLRGERWGWDRTPANRITWAELAEQIGDDPRRAELIAWAQSLPAPAWQDLARPHELWPNPGQWHPGYITSDHQRPGWDQRIAAWRDLLAILTDAISRLEMNPCTCRKTGPAPDAPPRRQATKQPKPVITWYVDRPGNVYHRGDCPNREDAPRWRQADGLTAAQLSFITGDLCPAPCARGLRCADHDFGPTGTRRRATPTPTHTAVPARDEGALFDLEVTSS